MALATDLVVSNRNMLLHCDYERDRGDGYPQAHLQICATSLAWEETGRRVDGGDVRLLDELHLPVGGRRFLPTLEDISEFLTVENLVKSRPKSSDAVERSHDAFREKQLRAAIRRYPEVVLDQLCRDGHRDVLSP
jgi:hypothetical protein